MAIPTRPILLVAAVFVTAAIAKISTAQMSLPDEPVGTKQKWEDPRLGTSCGGDCVGPPEFCC
jgi:hypothetical protein